jgi:uncharacterized protein YehS (DUF1456 family)
LEAHEVKESHFVLKKLDGHWVVQGDFPWILRNALIKFDPTVEKAMDQKIIDAALFSYVQSNLILKNQRGESIPLVRIEPTENPEHSHQIRYDFHFEGGDLAEITNTLMINVNEDQVNYLVFFDGEEMKNFKTSKNNTFIQLEKENHQPISWFWVWMGLIAALGSLVYLKKRNV